MSQQNASLPVQQISEEKKLDSEENDIEDSKKIAVKNYNNKLESGEIIQPASKDENKKLGKEEEEPVSQFVPEAENEELKSKDESNEILQGDLYVGTSKRNNAEGLNKVEGKTVKHASDGKDKISTKSVNSSSEQDPENPRRFSIRIGGRKYFYLDNPDPPPSSASHSRPSNPSYTILSNRSKSYPEQLHSHGILKPNLLSQRVVYLPDGKPTGDLGKTYYQRYQQKFVASPKTTDPYTSLIGTLHAPHVFKMKSSTIAGDLCQIFSVFFALLVRVVMGAFCVLTVMVVVDKRKDERFWALTSILSLLVVESIYTIVKRRGQERRWVSWCFVCYLLACLPSVWLLELQKLGLFVSRYSNASGTTSELVLPGGLTTSFALDSDDIIFIMENCLVFLLILCRWLLPRGDITRNQLSQLLFVFIGMGSDVMELFQLFENEEVKKNRMLSYIILGVWSLSLFQFTLVLTMSANPKKARVALDTAFDDDGMPEIDFSSAGGRGVPPSGAASVAVRQRRTFKDFLIRSEVWSLFVTILMQDGPYLAVRLYAVLELKIIDSTIVFFVCKNSIVILLLLYRLIVVGLLVSEDRGQDSDYGKDYMYRNQFLDANGVRKHLHQRTVPTVSGRSAVTDMTTLTPSSTTTRSRPKPDASVEPSATSAPKSSQDTTTFADTLPSAGNVSGRPEGGAVTRPKFSW